MYPHERSLVKKMEGKPFVLLGVNSDGDKDKLHARMKEENITWRSWWDGGDTNGPIANQFNVHGWPTLYVVDHRGIIRHKWTGFPGEETTTRPSTSTSRRSRTTARMHSDFPHL